MPGDSTGQGTPLPIASGRGDTAQRPWAAARIGPFHDCPHKGQRTREQGGQQETSLSLRHPPRIASHHQKPGLDQNPPHFLGTRGMEQQRHQRDSEGTARGPPPQGHQSPQSCPQGPQSPPGLPQHWCWCPRVKEAGLGWGPWGGDISLSPHIPRRPPPRLPGARGVPPRPRRARDGDGHAAPRPALLTQPRGLAWPPHNTIFSSAEEAGIEPRGQGWGRGRSRPHVPLPERGDGEAKISLSEIAGAGGSAGGEGGHPTVAAQPAGTRGRCCGTTRPPFLH